nr:HNH endonuclease [uncultured Sphingorhabdus sp.]
MAKKNRDYLYEDEEAGEPVLNCWLCARAMGDVVEWHHPVPKSRGGKTREPVHPICHQTIHANFTNSDLEKRYATAQALLSHDEIRRFVDWVANKPPDFYAPTKDRR